MISDSTNQASTARRQLRARHCARRCRTGARGARRRQAMAPVLRTPLNGRACWSAWLIMPPPATPPGWPRTQSEGVPASLIRARARQLACRPMSRDISCKVTWDSPFFATEGTMATGYNVRVGDADREAIAAQLREHYADGRLTLEELNERLDQAFAATTKADLNTVTRDLPQATRPTAGAPYGGTGWQGQAWQRQAGQGPGWQGPGWQGPMSTRPGQDDGSGWGSQGSQRPRGMCNAFAPLMGLLWLCLVLGGVFLFGLG